MHLIDPQDRYTMAAVDPWALDLLATAVIDAKTGSAHWRSEEAHDEHSYHDEIDPACVHCRIHRAFNGNGHQVAKAQVAISMIREDGDQ